jgi:hypothetical protein
VIAQQLISDKAKEEIASVDKLQAEFDDVARAHARDFLRELSASPPDVLRIAERQLANASFDSASDFFNVHLIAYTGRPSELATSFHPQQANASRARVAKAKNV